MAENVFGDFFLNDADDELLEAEDELIAPPVVVPAPAAPAPVPQAAPQQPQPVMQQPAPAPMGYVQPEMAAPAGAQPSAAAPVMPQPGAAYSAGVAAPAPVAPAPVAYAQPAAEAPRSASREERLAEALNQLMEDSQEIQAAALVSLDGFTMASALPEGMQEDRVGAMSAAILGLGERAAAELGRGQLSQVFIEGEDGYVLLIAAGDRAVLTALADRDAKLGLVLYDMRWAAQTIGEILG